MKLSFAKQDFSTDRATTAKIAKMGANLRKMCPTTSQCQAQNVPKYALVNKQLRSGSLPKLTLDT